MGMLQTLMALDDDNRRQVCHNRRSKKYGPYWCDGKQ